jgi:hypothetical protein
LAESASRTQKWGTSREKHVFECAAHFPYVNEAGINAIAFGAQMDHVETIKRLLQTVQASQKMHAVLITGPAGFGKSTAVEDALVQSGANAAFLGAYSSPLGLFNFFHENSGSGTVVVIDDTSGIYGDPQAMAILKAATWAQGKPRVLRWRSTTGRANVEEFEFCAKVIAICNSFPTSADAKAVRSRSFPYHFEVSHSHIKELLLKAAANPKWYAKVRLATEVAEFLSGLVNETTEVSFRTLQMGYELAEHNPGDWKLLLQRMVVTHGAEDPRKLIKSLAKDGMTVREQYFRFEKATGLKRRTFFKYRQELDLASDRDGGKNKKRARRRGTAK